MMISRSVDPRVSPNTVYGRRVHTWDHVGRCTVQGQTVTGRVGYPGGASREDKASYVSNCTPENRHMTGGGTPAGNGAPNTEHRVMNTETDR